MTTIVIAAIALLVLIVLIAIFGGRMKQTSNEFDKADNTRDAMAEQIKAIATGGPRCVDGNTCGEGFETSNKCSLNCENQETPMTCCAPKSS